MHSRCEICPLNPHKQVLALRFCTPKLRKSKSWVYSACLEKNFLSFRSTTPIVTQIRTFYCFTYHYIPVLIVLSIEACRESHLLQHGLNLLFLPYLNGKWHVHNSAVVSCTTICLLPLCSSCNSASDDIVFIMYYEKMAARTSKTTKYFEQFCFARTVSLELSIPG